MVEIDLNRLRRTRTIIKRGNVESEEFDVAGFGICLKSPVNINLKAARAENEDLLILGTLQTRLKQKCRRCLIPVITNMNVDLDLHFRPKDAVESLDEIEEELQFDWNQGHLDLNTHLVQEIVLSAPTFVECDETCQGICAGCGVDLNQLKCDCPEQPADPRWDVLIQNPHK
ncbi:uncharacterized protein METZ01_LOCUS161987 [marine metagenome]|uniref:DUF177 domain-containing protein n=1 Tax=marine metagenome TaxID=408172 RepID=A0A382B799_9ZZZZ